MVFLVYHFVFRSLGCFERCALCLFHARFVLMLHWAYCTLLLIGSKENPTWHETHIKILRHQWAGYCWTYLDEHGQNLPWLSLAVIKDCRVVFPLQPMCADSWLSLCPNQRQCSSGVATCIAMHWTFSVDADVKNGIFIGWCWKLLHN